MFVLSNKHFIVIDVSRIDLFYFIPEIGVATRVFSLIYFFDMILHLLYTGYGQLERYLEKHKRKFVN